MKPFSQIASFESYMPGYSLTLSLRFPAGTLMTDELPLMLPVSTALTRSFFVHPLSSFPTLFGTITSYESRLVPEPNSLCLIGVAGAALRRAIGRCSNFRQQEKLLLRKVCGSQI
ncbi:MAG: hypothetical protein IAG10_10260 [Planctomycetaceae bacterium]|nr:hypothetical protein [Planctomycetaceae bacterium]